MAALNATKQDSTVFGNRKVVFAELPAVSDDDTFKVNVGRRVEFALVQHTGASAVAADSIVVEKIEGDVLTFQVAGTARTAVVVAICSAANKS